MVLAWRAAEARRERPLFVDPVAASLTDRVEPWPVTPQAALFADLAAARTALVDDELARALAAGARQVVTLGAGLDTRPYRLALPEGVALWELDRPRVNALAVRLLPALAARRRVDTGLEDDWASRLREASHDASVPTAWVMEGVLEYLPATLWRRVAASITACSTPGSVAIVTALDPALPDRVRDDSTFPFRRLPPISRVAEALPGWSATVHLPGVIEGRSALAGTFAVVTLVRTGSARSPADGT